MDILRLYPYHGWTTRATKTRAPHPRTHLPGTESLRVLRNSNCVNLTDMNFLDDDASVDNDSWVNALFDLVAVNPHLTVISLENFGLNDASIEAHINRFLYLLDQNPTISSVYIGTDSHISDESGAKLTAIQSRLLARVLTDDVRAIYVRTAIPTSSRGLPTHSGCPWPARESPAEVKDERQHIYQEVKHIAGQRA